MNKHPRDSGGFDVGKLGGLPLRLLRRAASDLDIPLLLLLLVFTLPVSLEALRSYFTFDDLMNLHYYTSRPLESLLSNLLVFTSFRRPLGALVYLPVFASSGLNPVPYYLAGIVFFTINIALVYMLFRVLAGRRFVPFLAASLFALHPEIHNVLFNFGAVFELLCQLFLLASTLLYVLWNRGHRTGPRLYLLSLLCFAAALNAKETAVVLPGLLLAYELLLSSRAWTSFEWKRMALRLAPFALVVLPYTAAKLLGDEAYWRENPQYVYQFDGTLVVNFTEYLSLVSNREIEFTPATAIVSFLAAAGIAGLLRSRLMLFGLGWAVLTLLPVLPLPRVWGLFLYIPLSGFALAVASLIEAILKGVIRRLPEPVRLLRPGRVLVLICAAAFLFRILGAMSPDIDRARRAHYHERNTGWRPFAEELFRLYPSLPSGSVLGFVAAPFNPETHERWCLNFLVWLNYGPDIRVVRLPSEAASFRSAAVRAPESHVFEWIGGKLVEVDPAPFLP